MNHITLLGSEAVEHAGSAMRCSVASRLGDEVTMPKELL